MKNYKKIQPLRHIKINSLAQSNDANNNSFVEEVANNLHDPAAVVLDSSHNSSFFGNGPDQVSASTSLAPITSYKQFIANPDTPAVEVSTVESSSTNPFKLPKFLNRNNINEPVATAPFQGAPKSLPFSKPDFTENPNSFTSVFKKDNDQVTGVKRVFRKSVMFLLLQVAAFLSLIAPVLFGISSNFSNGINSTFSLSWNISAVIVYVVMTSIFYVIVADRSYIWISLFLQAMLMVASYSLVGMGFNPITLIATGIILILSYFSYLEIEKIQVSSRFFSIGYVTSEAVKILSTIAILILSLSFFNYIIAQDSKTFVSNNLIQNDFLFKNVVIGKVPAFSLNKQFSSVRYELTDDNRVITRDGAKEVPVTFMSFLMENSPFGAKVLDDKETEDIRKTECTASVDCNRILERKKQAKILTWINTDGNPYANLAIRDTPTQDLNQAEFKTLMKAFYSDKISELESKKTDKELTNIPFIGNLGKQFQEYNKYLIPASIALFIFAILSIFKFLIHTLIGIAMWIVWKFLVLVGFVQIEVELVESEIVSI